jgi:hypothetical protein
MHDYFALVNKTLEEEKRDAQQPRRSDRPKPKFKLSAHRKALT